MTFSIITCNRIHAHCNENKKYKSYCFIVRITPEGYIYSRSISMWLFWSVLYATQWDWLANEQWRQRLLLMKCVFVLILFCGDKCNKRLWFVNITGSVDSWKSDQYFAYISRCIYLITNFVFWYKFYGRLFQWDPISNKSAMNIIMSMGWPRTDNMPIPEPMFPMLYDTLSGHNELRDNTTEIRMSVW